MENYNLSRALLDICSFHATEGELQEIREAVKKDSDNRTAKTFKYGIPAKSFLVGQFIGYFMDKFPSYIKYENLDVNKTGFYGYIWFNKMLAPKDVIGYGLKFIE